MTVVNTGAGRGGLQEKLEITPEIAKMVAGLHLDGQNTNEIIKAVKLSYPSVRRIMASPEFTAEIKAVVRNRVARLADKMVSVLEAQLAEGNLDAVKVGFKVLSVLDPEPEARGESVVNVILPGAAPAPKDVIAEVVPDES